MVKMKSKFFIALLVLFLHGCVTCNDIRNSVLPKEYNFKITKKEYYQYVILDGVSKNNKSVQFKEFEYWGIYDSIQIGDTLIKYKGSTDLILKKPNRTDSIVLEMYCGDQPMWKYEQ